MAVSQNPQASVRNTTEARLALWCAWCCTYASKPVLCGLGLLEHLQDFGLSRLRSSVLITERPAAGTPAYTAPVSETHDQPVDSQGPNEAT